MWDDEETAQEKRLRELNAPAAGGDSSDVSAVLAAYEADKAAGVDEPQWSDDYPPKPIPRATADTVLPSFPTLEEAPFTISLEGRALKDICTKLMDLMVSRGSEGSLVEVAFGKLMLGNCEPVEVRNVKLRFNRDQQKSVDVFYDKRPLDLRRDTPIVFKKECPLCKLPQPIDLEHACDPPGVVTHGAGSRMAGWDAEGWYAVLYKCTSPPGEIMKMERATQKLRSLPSALWELRGQGEMPWDKPKGARRTATYYDDYAKIDHPKGESANQEQIEHTLPSGRKLTLGGPLRPIVIFDNKEEMLRRACEYYGDAEGDESMVQYLNRNNLIARKRAEEDRWEVVPREGHAAHAIIVIPNTPVRVDLYAPESVVEQIETQTKNTGIAMVRVMDKDAMVCRLCKTEVSTREYLEKGHGCKEGRAFDLEFVGALTEYLAKKNRGAGRRVLAMEGEDRLAGVREDRVGEAHLESAQVDLGAFGRLPKLPEGPGPHLLEPSVREPSAHPGSDAEDEPEEIRCTETGAAAPAGDLEQLRALRDATC